MHKITHWPLTLYFDGECPLCAREIKILRARAKPDRLRFVDISGEAFDAGSVGFTLAQMESSLHARFDDGTWVTGLDATLWSWRAAGLGVWAAPLSWRLTRPLLDIGYRLFVAGVRIWPGCPIRMAVLAAGVTAVQCRKPTELRTTSDCLTLVDCICAKRPPHLHWGGLFSRGCYLLSQMIQACQYQFVSPDIIQIGDGMGASLTACHTTKSRRISRNRK